MARKKTHVYVEIRLAGAEELTHTELVDLATWLAILLDTKDPGDPDDVPGTFAGRKIDMANLTVYANAKDLAEDVAKRKKKAARKRPTSYRR